MRNVPLQNWGRLAYDSISKVKHCTNNMTESWNFTLGTLRRGHVLVLLEGIKKQVMTMIAMRNREVTTSADPMSKLMLSRFEKTAKARRDFDKR